MSDKVARGLLRTLPKAIDPAHVPGSSFQALTGPEVAACLAGLPLISESMVRARVLGSEPHERFVRGWLLPAVISTFDRKKWIVSFDRKKIIAEIVGDDLYPGRCRECKGRQELPSARGIPETCPACAGRGWTLRTGKQKAELLSVAHQTWCNVWSGRATAVLCYAQGIESAAMHRVAQKLASVADSG